MSWFNRKSRNRRSGREQHVLDVKLRSDQVRANRLRWSAIGLALLTTTLAGFFIVWHAGEWALEYFVYENPAFAVNKIEAQTDGVISADQLRRWSGVKIGQNLLALDLARVKRDLEMVLKLRVVEREPVAQLSVLRLKADGNTGLGLVFLDRDGYVMSPADCPQRLVSAAGVTNTFPAVCGLSLGDIDPGKRLSNANVKGALQLIEAFQRSPMAGLTALQQIDVSGPDILQITTSNQGKVVFSLDNFDQQLRRWRDICDHARELGKTVVTLDLSVPGNIPAVLNDIVAETPAPGPRTPKPQPNRRRNV